MPTTLAIRRRRRLNAKGIGLPGDNANILKVARQLRPVVDAPVLGGVAVYLHGVPRATVDLDLYAVDLKQTADQLLEAGAQWKPARREHVLDGVPIHLVGADETGITIERTSVIDGIRVVTLKDLVAIKLRSGLKNRGRSKDLGDVEELIRRVPLDKRFAGKLPKELRNEFKAVVDAVRAGEDEQPRDRRL